MNHNNLYLSIGSALSSALCAFLGVVTQYNIAWAVSLVAGVVAIRAGYLTIKEKKMSIKLMEDHKKRNSGGKW